MNKLELFIMINISIIFMNFIFCSESKYILIAKKNNDEYKLEIFSYVLIYLLSIKIYFLLVNLNLNDYFFYMFLINYIYFFLSTILCILKIFNNSKLKRLEILFPLVKSIGV